MDSELQELVQLLPLQKMKLLHQHLAISALYVFVINLHRSQDKYFFFKLSSTFFHLNLIPNNPNLAIDHQLETSYNHVGGHVEFVSLPKELLIDNESSIKR